MKHSEIKSFINNSKSSLLFFLIVAVCIIPNIALSITENLSAMQRVTNVVLPLGIYLLLASASRKIGRTGIWMFILMFFAAFQIVLLFLFGRSVIAVDMFLNLVTTNPGEVGELLGNMAPVILLVAVIYIPTLVISIIATVKKWRLGRRFLTIARKTAFGVTAAGLVFMGLSFFSSRPYNPISDIYPANVAENIVLAVTRTAKINRYHTTSRDFTFHARSLDADTTRRIVVMVIGETSRAPQWHIFGYPENTTAPLDSLSGLVKFPKAVSESNTTHKSVPMLLSYVDANCFEDSIYTHKSVITAFKEAGYRTAFISNQAPNHSFIDFFGEEADTTLFINKFAQEGERHRYDHELLPELRKFVETNKNTPKLLIVLHTYGSHFCYSDRYRPEDAVFLPDSPINVTASNTTNLVNAYNNSINYTASLLASIAKYLESTGTQASMLYTSDHGEDIFDDSRNLFLHASPVPSYYQIHVPMLLWFSAEHGGTERLAQANSALPVSTSATFFHTALDMGHISTPYFNPALSLISPKYTPAAPVYLNDHNRGIPLKECGLQQPDFDCFRRAGIPL